MERSTARPHMRPLTLFYGATVLLSAVVGAGCQGGKSANPFQSGPTRIPAPPTRSFQTNGAGYYNAPSGPTGAPGSAVGTGVGSAGAGGNNWSSTPGAVNATNSNGVYTSWLERSDAGYSVKSGPANPANSSGANPAATKSSGAAPSTPAFPQAPLRPASTTSFESTPRVQPADYQEPSAPSTGSTSNANLPWRVSRP